MRWRWRAFRYDLHTVVERACQYPWHVICHVRLGQSNNYLSRWFCVWCVDDRMAGWSARWATA